MFPIESLVECECIASLCFPYENSRETSDIFNDFKRSSKNQLICVCGCVILYCCAYQSWIDFEHALGQSFIQWGLREEINKFENLIQSEWIECKFLSFFFLDRIKCTAQHEKYKPKTSSTSNTIHYILFLCISRSKVYYACSYHTNLLCLLSSWSCSS